MTRYLYRYTCKPNYPVCEAYVLFHSGTVPTKNNWPSMMILAEKLASDAGCYYPNQQATLVYLGEFEPIKSFKHLPVLACATGEY